MTLLPLGTLPVSTVSASGDIFISSPTCNPLIGPECPRETAASEYKTVPEQHQT